MSGSDITPVILAGGGGTRLWPLSRAMYPKQFQPLLGHRSLMQQTLLRLRSSEDRFAPPIVICNEAHRFLVAEQLRNIACRPAELILEPQGRNTAPAACIAALRLAGRDPDALLLLLPSDHAIVDDAAFLAAVERAAAGARRGWLVTFGVTPNRAETGYGYIRRGEAIDGLKGTDRLARFVEKPDAAAAEGYLAEGGYLWNSGMFLLPARLLLAELERLQPLLVRACRRALASAGRDLDFLRLGAAAFQACPATSIDRAVMEHTDRAAVVPVDLGWSDVGSWAALWEALDKDAAGNAVSGDVLAERARDCLLRADGRLLAAVGVENLVVAVTDDAVLVCPRDQAQAVGPMVARLKEAERAEATAHSEVFRPWGSYRGVDQGARFQVKRLTLAPGSALSLQRHRHRAEHWVVVEGEAEVTRDGNVFRLQANESTYIPRGTVHRLANPGETPLHVIEVQSGDYLGEDDIERFDDVYGRASRA